MTKTHVIDGVTFVEVDRKAEVGDKIIVTRRWFDINVGEVLEVISGEDFGFSEKSGQVYHAHPDNSRGIIKRIEDDYYTVLKPLSTVDTSEASPALIEMLTSLSRKIVSLESQLRDTQNNLEKQAAELANTRHRLAKHADRFAAVEDKVEMLTDDIVTLDSRSQVLNAINKYYAEGRR
jgi:hypothetical protein